MTLKVQKAALLTFTKKELEEAKESQHFTQNLTFINNLLLFAEDRKEWTASKVLCHKYFLAELAAEQGRGYQCLN